MSRQINQPHLDRFLGHGWGRAPAARLVNSAAFETMPKSVHRYRRVGAGNGRPTDIAANKAGIFKLQQFATGLRARRGKTNYGRQFLRSTTRTHVNVTFENERSFALPTQVFGITAGEVTGNFPFAR